MIDIQGDLHQSTFREGQSKRRDSSPWHGRETVPQHRVCKRPSPCSEARTPVVGTGGSFGSSSLQLEIGLGRTRRIVSLEVRWPSSGPPSRFTDVPLDRVLQVREGATALQELKPPKFRLARDPGAHEHRHGGGAAGME